MLLKVERQAQIRKLVEERRQVTVAELSVLLHVSEATIRRDLDEMDGEWLRRTHGGAVILASSSGELPVHQRASNQADAKRRIGRAAAEMVREGETVFISSGTTSLEVARALPPAMHLTVISNSLLVVNELVGRPEIELVVVGGLFRPDEFSMVGHTTEMMLGEFRANRTFMGMRSIDPRFGFTNDYLPEVVTDRAILKMSSQVVALADCSKFGQVSPVFLAPVTAADIIISNSNLDPEMAITIREQGIQLILV